MVSFEQLASVSTSRNEAPSVASDNDTPSVGRNFQHTIRLGDEGEHDGERSAPPSGSARLKGRVLYRGEPQQGVRLYLSLNEQYKTKMLETNADGVFSVSLPSGPWRINRVKTKEWPGKPDDRRYSVITGHEPTFDVPYHRQFAFDRAPPAVKLPEDSGPHLSLTIREPIEMDWPPAEGEPVEADMEADSLEWNDPTNAARYVISLPRFEKQGTTTHFRNPTYAVTEGKTRLPLAELPRADASGERNRYAVRVSAFDVDGRLVNYTEHPMKAPVFRLHEVKLVDNSDWLDKEDETTAAESQSQSAADWQARHEAKKQLEAADTLIDEAMYHAAEALLARVDPQHAPPAKLPRLLGILAAHRGHCEKARNHLEEARNQDPEVCVADCLADKCPELGKFAE
jgi:hypothetical protein